MTENGKKRSFWTSLPGIFAGAAAILTAVTGLYIAIGRDGEPQLSIKPPSPPSAVKSTSLPNEWPLILEETFTESPSRWSMGSYPDKNSARFDLKIVGGKYRWDVEFRQKWERWIEAPSGPATDFYLAVDVKFVAFASDINAILLFGSASSKHYGFRISSNKFFELSRFDGTKSEMIIDWTPISINPKESNRIAVAVRDQQIKLYINSKLLGAYKDSTFTGGKVGLGVGGWQPGVSMVVDFDNFEFRRKP